MTAFSRTPSGQANQYLFYKHPLIWVEGKEDSIVLGQILDARTVAIKAAGGRSKIEQLAEEIVTRDLPFVVFVDADYDAATSRRSEHRRVVRLRRYSVENYLVHPEIVESVARELTGLHHREVVKSATHRCLHQVDTAMHSLVVLDMANQKSGAGNDIWPSKPQQLSVDGKRAEPDKTRVDAYVKQVLSTAPARVPKVHISSASRVIADHAKRSPLWHVVRGHYVYQVVISTLNKALRANGGGKLDERSFLVPLARRSFLPPRMADHESVFRRLRKAVNEVRRLRGSPQ